MAARHIALERAAYALINRADNHVSKTNATCKPSLPRPSRRTTHDAPTQPVLDAIAVLRRPAKTADAFPDRRGMFLFGETYIDYTRSVTAASGKSFYVVIGRGGPPSFRPSAACLDAEHAQLVKLLRGKNTKLRAAALGAFGKLRHGWEQNAAQPTTPQDGIYLFTKGARGVGIGGGGGGAGIADFLKHGTFISSGRDAGSTLVGLVPDGVATVTLQYPKTVSRGRWYKPTIFPRAYTRTVRVQQNTLSVHVPRGAGDAFPPRMIWRSAEGKIVRVVKQPGL